MTHGTLYAYVHKKCKCVDCRARWNANATRYRQQRIAEGKCPQCGVLRQSTRQLCDRCAAAHADVERKSYLTRKAVVVILAAT